MHSTWFSSTFVSFLKFSQINEGGPNFLGNQFCRTAELFGPPFCISIWEIWGTQILRHSVDFNAFYMIQQYFVSFLKFFQIKEGGPNSLGEPILQNGWIIWSPLLYFNLRNLRDPNSSSFSRFQCILHDSAVLLSVF